MKDPEFIKLKNKFFITVFVVLVFSIPLLFFVYKTYSNSNIITKINKKETFAILVISNECNTCEFVKDILDSNNVRYTKLNRSTNKDYNRIMNKMGITNKREIFPIIIYVEDGRMEANLFNIVDENSVTSFLESHGLINSK